MKKKFLEYYRSIGIKKIDSILGNTPIIDSSTFFLPRGSLLHLNTFAETLRGPTANENMFEIEQKVYVNNILAYNNETIGSFRRVSGVQLSTVAKALKKEAGKTSIKFPLNKYIAEEYNLLVYNYDALAGSYKYNNHTLSMYYKWYNTFSTVINNVVELQNSNINRKHYITIEIPNVVPHIKKLKEFAKKEMSRMVVNEFNTYKLLTLLELWKYFTPATHANTLFAKLDYKKLDDVILVFKFKNKQSIARMSDLFSLANMYQIVNKDKNEKDPDFVPFFKENHYMLKIQPRVARVMILLLMNKIINNSAMSYAQVENGNEDINNFKQTDGKYNLTAMKMINSSSDDDDIEITEDDLTKVLEDYAMANIPDTPDMPTVPSEENIDDDYEEVENIPEAIEIEELNLDLKGFESKGIDFDMDDELEDIEEPLNLLEPEPTQTREEVIKVDKEITKENLLVKIKESKDGGWVSKNLGEQLEEIVTNQEYMQSPFGDDLLLKDYLDIDPENILIKEEDYSLPLKGLVPEGMDKDPIKAIDKHYVKNYHKKFLTSSFYKMQNTGLIVTGLKIVEDSTSLGEQQIVTIETTTLQGKKNTNSLILPKLQEDGTYKQSGVDYRLRRQSTQNPISKVNFSRVALTSHYGKLFIDRARNKNKDIGYWISKELALKTAVDNPSITNLISRGAIIYDVKLPIEYTYFARYTRGFTFNGFKFEFHYPSRIGLINSSLDNDVEKAKFKKAKLKEIEKDKYILVASNEKNNFLLMDLDNNLYLLEDSKYTNIGSILDYVELNRNSMPNEFVTINIFSKALPLVLLLSYYKGLIPLLKMLKTEYKIEKRTARISEEDLNKYLVYVFKDNKLLISKEKLQDRILFSGLDLIEKYFKDVRLSSLNNSATYALLFSNMELNKTYITELSLLRAMFIDPVTETVLKFLNMPTTFIGMLLKALELLLDDNYVDPNTDTEILIKGSERLIGFVYSELVKSTRNFKNREEFSRANLTIDPYAVWRQIGDDSTSVLVKHLNPVDYLKQTEEVTKIGAGGISRDAITKEARSYHPSAVGTISEATKDSSSVGISTYLTAAPKLTNVLGIKTPDAKDNGIAGRLSTSALLAPFVETEASKRAGFISIQNGHVAPIDNAEIPYIRTLEELAIAYRVGKPFTLMAEEDGEVTKLTKNLIEVTYLSGKKDSMEIGVWSTRPESNKAFKHLNVTDLKLGDKFSKNDPIAWNSSFFEKDWLFEGKLVYKMATFGNVGLSEEPGTYEDSSILSSAMHERVSTRVYDTRGFIFNGADRIESIPKVNDKLKPDTLLFTIVNPTVTDVNLSKEVLQSLQEVKNNYAYAEKAGALDYVEAYYNCTIDELSLSFQELIKDKNLVRTAKQVSNQYSVNGKPLAKGEIHIVFFISSSQLAGGGEKIVFANQLKSIVGDIVTYPMYTQKNKIPTDAFFGKISVENRVVNSAYIMGTNNIVLYMLGKEVAKLWNGK